MVLGNQRMPSLYNVITSCLKIVHSVKKIFHRRCHKHLCTKVSFFTKNIFFEVNFIALLALTWIPQKHAFALVRFVSYTEVCKKLMPCKIKYINLHIIVSVSYLARSLQMATGLYQTFANSTINHISKLESY